MQNDFLSLDYIINVDNFQKIQDSLAEATEMAMLTVNYKGTPVTKHSKCNDFCKMVRSNPYYSQLCEKCDSRGGLEATRLKQPYIYICHMGLLDFAVPIIVKGQYIGAVLAGQVLIIEELEKEKLERIVIDQYHKDDLNLEKELEVLYKKIPIMAMDRVKAVADMVFNISNYIVEEALLKINLNEVNQKILSLSTAEDTESKNNNIVGSKENSIVNKTGEISKINSNECEANGLGKNKQEYLLYRDNIILRPAMEYIQSKYTQAISLDEMASLCNISTSYFSKLFKKVAGDNFANYINKVRIKKAKEFLETSHIPITEIAFDLGFEDCGYFIKVFKKLEGLTPLMYRNQHFNITTYY